MVVLRLRCSCLIGGECRGEGTEGRWYVGAEESAEEDRSRLRRSEDVDKRDNRLAKLEQLLLSRCRGEMGRTDVERDPQRAHVKSRRPQLSARWLGTSDADTWDGGRGGLVDRDEPDGNSHDLLGGVISGKVPILSGSLHTRCSSLKLRTISAVVVETTACLA